MHFICDLRTVVACFSILDAAHFIFKQWRVDEVCPDVQDIQCLVGQVREAPDRVCGSSAVPVLSPKRFVKLDHAENEGRRENADAAEVEQVHGIVIGDGIIAEMRITMDHAIFIEWHIPCAEHVGGDLIADVYRRVIQVRQITASQPIHGDQAICRKVRQGIRHLNAGLISEHMAVERHVLCFEAVIQFLTQPFSDLKLNVVRVDG